MKQDLAEWLKSEKYTYISADHCECCGTSIDLDADAMAAALIRWFADRLTAET